MKKSSSNVSRSEDWHVETDLRTMVEADKIEKDPKRMAKVRALAKERMMEIAAIASETE